MDQPSIPLAPPAKPPTHSALVVIQRYNALVRDNTTGPNCVDPAQCRGDCCSIMIDVPRVLVDLYVDQGWITSAELRRGGPFAFRLGVSDQTAKCVFFDPRLNGCRVHFTGFKPPQCWIYPTGFAKGEKICKKGYTWDLIDGDKAVKAEQLLEEYKAFSLEEVQGEVARLKAGWAKSRPALSNKLKSIPPARFLGMTWVRDGLQPLDAAGYSLQIKGICESSGGTCAKDFMECGAMCELVVEAILSRYENRLDLFYQRAECMELLQMRDLK
jgi:Fe-S-cluster containining protein